MRILFLAPCAPWPSTSGRTQRTHVLHRALSRLGDVDMLIVPPPPREDWDRLEAEFGMIRTPPKEQQAAVRLFSLLRRRPSRTVDFLGHLLRYHPWMYRHSRPMECLLADVVERNRYDLIVGRYSLLPCKVRAHRYAPLIVDVDDIDYMIPWTEAEHGDTSPLLRPVLRHCARGIKPIVQTFWKHCEHLWLAAAADAEHVESGEVSELPNIPFADTPDGTIQPCPPNDASRTILLVAYARWYPNRDGIERFLHGAWPLVLARHPDARLEIIGKASELDTARWARHRNVHPRGFVDDLRAAYAGAAFAVAPIFVGGGTKIKVLESLAHGRACVVTPHSHRGHETALPDGKAVLRRDTEAGLAEACNLLLENPGKRRELAEFGADAVGRYYSQQRVDEIVANTVERVLRRRREAA